MVQKIPNFVVKFSYPLGQYKNILLLIDTNTTCKRHRQRHHTEHKI